MPEGRLPGLIALWIALFIGLTWGASALREISPTGPVVAFLVWLLLGIGIGGFHVLLPPSPPAGEERTPQMEPAQNRYETMTHAKLKQEALRIASRLRAIQTASNKATDDAHTYIAEQNPNPTGPANSAATVEWNRRLNEAYKTRTREVEALQPEVLLIYDELRRRLPALDIPPPLGGMTFGAGPGGLNQGAQVIETYAQALPDKP